MRQLGGRQRLWDNIRPVKYQQQGTLQFQKIITEQLFQYFRDCQELQDISIRKDSY